MGSLNILKYNLHEIHAASSIDGADLVSNIKGTRVYLSSKGWGRLWTWFYSLTKPFLKEDLRVTKLRAAILNIDDIFATELENVRVHAEVYEEYLRLRLNSNEVDETDYHEARRVIKDWHQATHLFFKESFLSQETELCVKYLQEEDMLPIFSEAPEKSLSQIHYVIKLEGKLQGPLPLDLLGKEATGQKMTKKEKKNLYGWISQFQKVRALHKLLTSLSPFMDNPDIVKFEINCVKNNCTLIKNADPKHVAWRETLKPGSMLGGYALGAQVGKKAGGFDEQIFYDIPEDPNILMMISTNRALLGAKEAWAKEGAWGLKTPVFEYIDPKGKFAVVERFETCLRDINWISRNKFLTADKIYAEPIANYVQWLLKKNISVSQLDPKNIMFDIEGKLRTVKIQERARMNYPLLENFLFETSKDNLPVFQYMMRQSGLLNTKYASFYKAAVKEALQEGMPDIRGIGANRFINDSRDIEKATELCSSLIKIQNKLVVQCRTNRQTAGKVLLDLYLKSDAASVLWPTLETDASAAL